MIVCSIYKDHFTVNYQLLIPAGYLQYCLHYSLFNIALLSLQYLQCRPCWRPVPAPTTVTVYRACPCVTTDTATVCLPYNSDMMWVNLVFTGCRAIVLYMQINKQFTAKNIYAHFVNFNFSVWDFFKNEIKTIEFISVLASKINWNTLINLEILETALRFSNLQPDFQNYHYHKDSTVVTQSFFINMNLNQKKLF